MEPTRGRSCPPGERQGPAASGKDKAPSPYPMSFHTFANPTTRTRKQGSPSRYRPARCGNSNPRWLIADWLGLMEPARRESCPLDQRRGPDASGEDKVSPPDKNPSISLQLQQLGDENRDPPGRYHPARCGNPNPHRLIADWLGLMEPARGESCPSGQRRGPAAPGEDIFPSPDHASFQISTPPTTRGRKR